MKKTLKRFVLTLVAVAALAATAGYWSGSRIKAGVATSPTITLGMVGIAEGQAARLNLINISDTSSLPGPCQVTMKFFDSQGNTLAQSGPTSLDPGHAAFLDLSRASINSSASRVQIRAHAVLDAPLHCLPTLEVLDNLTGRTMVQQGVPGALQ